MSEVDDDRKKRFWVVDPTMFEPGKPRQITDRVKDLLVPVGRIAFTLALFAYPLLVVYSGIAYGGTVFWTTLLASFVVLGLFLWKTGYSKNFEARTLNLKKDLLGLVLAFVLVLAIYEGLFHLGLWAVPIIALGGIVTLTLVLQRD